MPRKTWIAIGLVAGRKFGGGLIPVVAGSAIGLFVLVPIGIGAALLVVSLVVLFTAKVLFYGLLSASLTSPARDRRLGLLTLLP